MKKIFFLIFATSLIWLNESCKKDNADSDSVKIDMKGLWECNEDQNYDSTKLAAKLVGNWQWFIYSCYWSGTTNKADKDVRVTFTSYGTFWVKENSVIVTQGSWALKDEDSGILGLQLDTPSQYLYGRILLCDDQLLFNHSYIDGCDNFFVRN